MKNKKSIYILLPLVIVIWGTIFWKIFSGSSGEKNGVAAVNNLDNISKEQKTNHNKELSFDYPDPFSVALESNVVIEKVKEDFSRNRTLNRVVPWPDISFFGVVKNRDNGNPMALIEVNSKRCLVKTNGTYEGVNCFFLDKDSVGLEYAGERRYFKKRGIEGYEEWF